MAENEDVVLNQINSWNLDYMCFKLWNEFQEKNMVDQDTQRQSLQGLLMQIQLHEVAPDMERKKLFLQLLSQLADGTECCENYMDGSDKTALEWALVSCDNILENMKTSGQGSSCTVHVEELREALRTQAVAVSCQTGHFSCAEDVFDRIYSDTKVKKSKMAVRLSKIINSEDWENNLLQVLTYDKFLEGAKQRLGSIYSSLFKHARSLPFLVNVAVTVLSKRGSRIPAKYCLTSSDSERSPSSPSSDRQERRQRRGECEDTADSLGTQKKSRKRQRVPKSENESPSSSEESSVDEVPDRIMSAGRQVELMTRLGLAPSLTRKEKTQLDEILARTRIRYQAKEKRSGGGDGDDFPLHRRIGKPVMRKRPRSLETKHNPYSSLEKRRFWDDDETEKLFLAVKKIGPSWADIRDSYDFEGRTNVQLKDRWRSIQKIGIFEKLQAKHGWP